MMPELSIFLSVFEFVSLISGVILNSSIIIIYIRNWRQNPSAGESDKIILTMAAANVLLECLQIFVGIAYYAELFKNVHLTFLMSLLPLIDVCFWNIFWLSISYCLKLVNVSHRFILWLKSRFSSAVTLLLVGSTLGSFVINVPFIWIAIVNVPPNGTGKFNIIDYGYYRYFPYIFFKIMLGSCLPSFVTLICIVLSVTSLLKHVWRILKNTSQIKYSQLEVHVRAARTMILLLFLDLVFCMVIVGLLAISTNIGLVLEPLGWLYIMVYPSLQSMILITANPKLKRHLFGHLHYLQICRK